MPRIPASFEQILIDRYLRQAQPGSEDAIFPRTLEDNAIFTFPGRATGLLWTAKDSVVPPAKGMLVKVIQGATNSQSTFDAEPAEGKLKYYHAIHASHNSTNDEDMRIQIDDPVLSLRINIAFRAALPASESLVVSRPIVIGEGARLRVRVEGLTAGASIVLSIYRAELDLAVELPGL